MVMCQTPMGSCCSWCLFSTHSGLCAVGMHLSFLFISLVGWKASEHSAFLRRECRNSIVQIMVVFYWFCLLIHLAACFHVAFVS